MFAFPLLTSMSANNAIVPLPLLNVARTASARLSRSVSAGTPDRLVLILYGTGIRGGKSVPGVSATLGAMPAVVDYPGAQPIHPGLDQVNVALPRALAGSGLALVRPAANGQWSKPVQIMFQ